MSRLILAGNCQVQGVYLAGNCLNVIMEQKVEKPACHGGSWRDVIME